MTPTRAQEFAETWNGGDAARVASYFADDGVYHASVGPEPLGASFVGRAEIARGAAAVVARCPGGRFETLRVTVAGTSTAGCDCCGFEGDQVKVETAVRKHQS